MKGLNMPNQPHEMTEEEAQFVFYAACAFGAVLACNKARKLWKKHTAKKKIEAIEDPVLKEKVLDMLAVHQEHNL